MQTADSQPTSAAPHAGVPTPQRPATPDEGGHGEREHGEGRHGEAAHGQQHPLALYFTVWGLLFLLSAGSYLVDYFNLHGDLRWGLIIFFMLAKASLIVAVFMHMAWERLALVAAILIPPLAVLVFVATMVMEGDYTSATRTAYFAPVAQTHGATP